MVILRSFLVRPTVPIMCRRPEAPGPATYVFDYELNIKGDVGAPPQGRGSSFWASHPPRSHDALRPSANMASPSSLIKFDVCMYKKDEVSYEDFVEWATKVYPVKAKPVIEKYVVKWTQASHPIRTVHCCHFEGCRSN